MRKKTTVITAALLTALLAFLLPAIPVFAYSTSLSVSSAAAHPGDSVEISVSVADNPGLAAIGFTLDYNPDVMTLVSAGFTELLGSALVSPDISQRPVIINFVSSANKFGNGVLLKLGFKIKDNAPEGVYPLKLAPRAAAGYVLHVESNYDFSDVSLNLSDGAITVTAPAACAHGNKTYYTVTPASCTAAGSKELKCPDCGTVFGTESIPATGHSFGAWTTVREPTEDAEGELARVCSVCGARETQATAKLPPQTTAEPPVTTTGPTVTTNFPVTSDPGGVTSADSGDSAVIIAVCGAAVCAVAICVIVIRRKKDR